MKNRNLVRERKDLVEIFVLFLYGAGGIANLEFYFADLVINLYSMGGAGAAVWLTLPYKNKRDRALADISMQKQITKRDDSIFFAERKDKAFLCGKCVRCA